MYSIISVTLKGVFRDRVFRGIIMAALLFLFIPAVASLSMRQVTELSITLSLSLISFILLLLSVFLGGMSLWRDLEKRYAIGVLGLPFDRNTYLVGRFLGNAGFLLISVLVLAVVSLMVVYFSSSIYPSPRPVAWCSVVLAILFDALKFIMLVAVAFLFSSFSTSFFLPIFGTISIFLVGSSSQEAYDFIQTAEGQKLPGVVVNLVRGLYYIIPNFSAFDLKVAAVYGLTPAVSALAVTFLYFIVYTIILISLSCLIFSRREI